MSGFATSLLLLASLLLSPASLAQTWPVLSSVSAYTIGVNKYDLFAQYTGTASGGDGSPAYLRVTRAMAKKAIADAADIGVRYMRVSLSGRSARNAGDARDSLYLWRADAPAFWKQVDEMMDDLDASGVQLIPVLAWSSGKFPGMAEEATGEMFRNPESRSWKMLQRFVAEFVTRYRHRSTVLFYELTNELNNYADLDLVKRCDQEKRQCKPGDRFTSADMVSYTRRFAALVRGLDPTRPISSGFSIPRPSAGNLAVSPEWKTGRANWQPDTREQFAKHLEQIHEGVDIISIHLYGGKKNWRFGSADAVDLLNEAKRVADRVGKPLFVGEFGDPDPERTDDRSHAVRMMDKLMELQVPFSAIWVWEFYQDNLYDTHNNRHTAHSLEPGLTDGLLDKLRTINRKGNPTAKALGPDCTPPRVVLTWPLECTQLTAPATLHAVASDADGPVTKVEFLVDKKVADMVDRAPFQFTLTAELLKPGRHHLSARAYDAAGNVATFSTMVRVGEGADCTPRPH
ncbi:MAG TPA: Ig-like domain-containing protein [Nitrospira sp.]|nr:Ig-like domain-containing protein [Nitrospira sp.]HNC82427.1 Ig-like domain-containing protein [Nitrospira sp.]